MSAKRHERTRARSNAVQMLYTGEIQGKPAIQLLNEGCAIEDIGELSDYAVALIQGVDEHVEAIDEHLASTSENWSISRMPIVDRTILRLATYEMVYVDDVPVSVSINEAVELAKEFGGKDESPSFVNGVLGRIAKGIEAGEIAPEQAEAEVAKEAAEEAAEAAVEASAEGTTAAEEVAQEAE